MRCIFKDLLSLTIINECLTARISSLHAYQSYNYIYCTTFYLLHVLNFYVLKFSFDEGPLSKICIHHLEVYFISNCLIPITLFYCSYFRIVWGSLLFLHQHLCNIK